MKVIPTAAGVVITETGKGAGRAVLAIARDMLRERTTPDLETPDPWEQTGDE